MRKRHFLVFDILTPALALLIGSTVFHAIFGVVILSSLNRALIPRIENFGIGSSQEPLVSGHIWLLFFLSGLILWLLYFRHNMQRDRVKHQWYLKRPIYHLLRKLLDWTDVQTSAEVQIRSLEARVKMLVDEKKVVRTQIEIIRHQNQQLSSNYDQVVKGFKAVSNERDELKRRRAIVERGEVRL